MVELPPEEFDLFEKDFSSDEYTAEPNKPELGKSEQSASVKKQVQKETNDPALEIEKPEQNTVIRTISNNATAEPNKPELNKNEQNISINIISNNGKTEQNKPKPETTPAISINIVSNNGVTESNKPKAEDKLTAIAKNLNPTGYFLVDSEGNKHPLYFQVGA